MKKIVITMLLSFIALSLFASQPTETDVQKRIKSEITYPDLARINHETGFVAVAFTLDSLGNIIVREVNSDNMLLKKYVVEKLSEMTFDCESGKCEDFVIRIDFQLI